MNDQVFLKIGKKIRAIRQKQNLKVHELSEMSSISKGLLSKIENGRTIPSLPVLIAIIQALKTEMSAFFEGINSGNESDYIHFRKEDYQPFEKEEAEGFTYQFIFSKNFTNTLMQVVLLELKANSKREKVTTDGFEFKYMLQGEVVYQLGNEEITLKEGESLFFDGKIPHVPINKTNTTTKMLVIYLLSDNV